MRLVIGSDLLSEQTSRGATHNGERRGKNASRLAPPSVERNRPRGLVVKASASRAADLGSNPASPRHWQDFATRMVYLDYVTCLRYTILVRRLYNMHEIHHSGPEPSLG